jgi:hypothetical protein
MKSGMLSEAELMERVRIMRRTKEPTLRAQEESLAEQLSQSGVHGLVLEDGSGVLVEEKRKPIQLSVEMVVEVLKSREHEDALRAAHARFFSRIEKQEEKMGRSMRRMQRRKELEDKKKKRAEVQRAIASAMGK